MALSLWHAVTFGIPHASSYFSRASAQASQDLTRRAASAADPGW